MRVALVNHTFSVSHGGLERVSVNLAIAIAAEGHEVHVFGSRLEDLPPGIVHHLVKAHRRPAWWHPLSFGRAVRRTLAGHHFDVIYGLTRFHPVDVYRLGDGIQRHWLRLRYPLSPWRWINCLFNPVHLVNLYLEHQLLRDRGCRGIITNSHLGRQHAQHYYGVAPERVDVIYNAVDPNLFSPESVAPLRQKCRQELNLEDSDVAIIYVSHNWKRKGLGELIRSLALLRERGDPLHLVVVGRGRSQPFVTLARDFGLMKRLHFVGPTKQVQRYYAAGDLLVLPTLYDPFANVCLEAMACGLPVITTATNGAAELITPGVNGYVQHDPIDALELSKLLDRCLDRDHLQQLGKAARLTSLPFTQERNTRETLALLQRVANTLHPKGITP